MKKIGKMNEAAWALGILLCALGVALCTKADFGLSMVAAPAYLFHLKFVPLFPWFSQGTAEYVWQAVLLLLLCIAIRRFTYRFLYSFGAAVLFGLAVDGWLFVFGGGGAYASLWMRILALILGEVITAFAIAFFFRTDLPLEIYELLVTELSKAFGWNMTSVKRWSDIAMFALSVLLAWSNPTWKGIGIGTVFITLVNATLINLCGKLLDKVFTFEPRFPKLVGFLKA